MQAGVGFYLLRMHATCTLLHAVQCTHLYPFAQRRSLEAVLSHIYIADMAGAAVVHTPWR